MLFVDPCCSLNAYFLESFKVLMAEANLAPVQIDKIMFEQGRPPPGSACLVGSLPKFGRDTV